MFSLAALTSAHLIFNTVRIIDSAQIEYLEILARRARLFQVKSQLNGHAPDGAARHDPSPALERAGPPQAVRKGTTVRAYA